MVRLLRHLKRPPWRTVVPLGAILLLIGLGYLVWSPGQRVRDGRHDLGTNAIGDKAYYGQVAAHVDQMAVMMYDTAIRWQKPYQRLMADWTQEVLAWAPNGEILLGVPVYDDADSGYHFPKVENLDNALVGIHAGLARLSSLPANYRGIAIYCEWEMDRQEWRLLGCEYGRAGPTSQAGG